MKIITQGSPPSLTVRILGSIDETARGKLGRLELPADVSSLTFDMSEVSWINSRGAADWLEYMNGLRPDLAVEFVRCAMCFIDYVLAIAGFAGHGTIRSMLLPYLCPGCRHHGLALVETANPALGTAGLRVACERCAGAAEPQVPLEDFMVQDLRGGAAVDRA